MKKRYFICFTLFLGILLGCEEDRLDKKPLTAVTPEDYFQKPNDFKIYMNQFYDDLGGYGSWGVGYLDDDAGTDNLVRHEPSFRLDGLLTQPVSDGDWSDCYRKIRGINYLLDRAEEFDPEEIQEYLGEARFFRAWYYFKLLKKFGGVPWIDRVIDPEDTEALTTPRTSRDELAEHMVDDLDFAIDRLPEKSKAEQFRVNKEAALAFKSRFCLYEGTWEKYHGKKGTPFQVDGADGTYFLQEAMNAALEVINSGNFTLDKNGDEPYNHLFNREDYSSSTEVILWRQHIRGLGNQNVTQMMRYGYTWGATSDLINAYLCTDGLPVALTSETISDYSPQDLVENRDPRCAQSIFYLGVPFEIDDLGDGSVTPFIVGQLLKTKTGLQQRKGYSPLASNLQTNMDQLAYIYFRYGEVLLNYIEAKAELAESGLETLTQNDFDISINKLRDRVDMIHFNYGEPYDDPDNLMTGLPWYLVEVRRERRVELAMEGFRLDDILRWAAADELIEGRIFRGISAQYYLDEGFYTREQIDAFMDEDDYLSPWHNTGIDRGRTVVKP